MKFSGFSAFLCFSNDQCHCQCCGISHCWNLLLRTVAATLNFGVFCGCAGLRHLPIRLICQGSLLHLRSAQAFLLAPPVGSIYGVHRHAWCRSEKLELRADVGGWSPKC